MTSKLFFILLFLCSVVIICDLSEEHIYLKFQKFKEKYNKNYVTIDETHKKYEIFKQNYIELMKYRDSNTDSQIIGITEFMDLTPEEFKHSHLESEDKSEFAGEIDEFPAWNEETPPVINHDADDGEIYTDQNSESESDNGSEENKNKGRLLQTIPSSYDWRSKGVVSSVLNQGACGGCWSFSALGPVETAYARKYGKLYNFSPQQIIDCNGYGYGCNGGTISAAMSYLRTYGAQPLSTYPFVGRKKACKYNYSQGKAKVAAYYKATTTNEASIASMLYNGGPLAININATPFQYYKSGIFNPSTCSNSVNHGVILVGYGSSNGVPYWIIKNSWGSSWGEAGYLRIYRGRKLCGMTSTVLSAKVQ